MTDFQQRVYEVVKRIPRGKVVSYGVVARAVGVNSAQAIGQALRRNPYAPEVPCHRVIRADGFMGGYLGEVSTESEKWQLLRAEGVRFDERGYLLSADAWCDEIPS